MLDADLMKEENLEDYRQGVSSYAFNLTVALVILVILIDAWNDYVEGGFSFFFLKHMVHSVVLFALIGLERFGRVTKVNGIAFAIYSVVFSIMLSIPVRFEKPGFEFEPLFLKVEMTMIIMAFAIGVMVQSYHIVIMILLNMLFLVFCFTSPVVDYPVQKLLFYFFLVNGTGYIGYRLHVSFVNLGRKLSSANTLVAETNVRLQKVNAFKDDLLRIIGHDVRTPFVQLDGLLRVWEDEDLSEEERKFMKSAMQKAVSQGDFLLQNLVKWTQTEAIDIQRHIEYISLEECVRSSLNLFEPFILEKKLSVVLDLDGRIKVLTDSRLMETICRNLISNAVKFSHVGDEIKVVTHAEPDSIVLQVWDNGVGMNDLQKSAIEDKTIMKSTHGTSNEKGSGLGLAISYRLIDQMGGKISVHSEKGKGTVFKVVLYDFKLDNSH